MGEIWKPLDKLVVNGYGYSVSTLGNVYSFKTKRILKQSKGGSGYYFVGLSQKCNVKLYDIHRLVAIAFIERETLDKLEVNHIDGNKENNRVENLEWVTRSENKLHAYSKGLRKPVPSSNVLKAILKNSKPVVKIDEKSGLIIATYQSANEAIKHEEGIARTTICYQCKNESNSSVHPYYFRYTTEEQVINAIRHGIYIESTYSFKEATE